MSAAHINELSSYLIRVYLREKAAQLTMQFFFPDSQDQIDPSFDFITEERSIYRVRQRDDRYAHEALRTPPFDGFLVSKTIVDGLPGAAGKYTIAQRHRLYRVGVREFFRLDAQPGPRLATMGDCGAFSYVREDSPPYSADEVIDFYNECGFDLGISVDHVILGYDPAADHDPEHPQRAGLGGPASAHPRTRGRVPDGVPGPARSASSRSASPKDGARPPMPAAVRALQKMGYRRIALGGMVPLKTDEVLACLEQIDQVRRRRHPTSSARHHAPSDHMEPFAEAGVTSFDSHLAVPPVLQG